MVLCKPPGKGVRPCYAEQEVIVGPGQGYHTTIVAGGCCSGEEVRGGNLELVVLYNQDPPLVAQPVHGRVAHRDYGVRV